MITAFFVVTISALAWMTIDGQSTGDSKQSPCHRTNDVPASHEEYLDDFGWHIQKDCGSTLEVIEYFPERLQMLKHAGLDLEPYDDKGIEAVVTTYRLKEKRSDASRLSAVLYEIDGEIVGGYGTMENWTPGLFALDEEERITTEDKVD
ncbi:DUF4830 domain-containing protein [Halobacillus litoralis]|uniref:DUF4830 domain-containing protein n=1 Tax=Halobacillus litoralis TaxID=45668 RepID=UPI001CD43FB5|nr:DUF4830 domain-containing protein [Halobacillus litoralis]MCA0969271.1 DUF4830 domain-containing protein [Halobacillus litoralis]